MDIKSQTPEVVEFKGKNYYYNDDDSYSFGLYKSNIILGRKNNISDSQSIRYNFSGRIWTGIKIISFWTFPSLFMLGRIISKLEDKLNIKIRYDEYKIKIVYGGKPNDRHIWNEQTKYNLSVDYIWLKDYIIHEGKIVDASRLKSRINKNPILELDKTGNIKIDGKFSISPKLTDFDRFYLMNFNLTPHYKRDVIKLQDLLDGSNGFKGIYGNDGSFYIRYTRTPRGIPTNKNYYEFDHKTVTDWLNPPGGMPGIQCPWKSDKTGENLIHDGLSQYRYNFKWLKWLMNNVLYDYVLNGVVLISDKNNTRRIILTNNKVKVQLVKGNEGISGEKGVSNDSVEQRIPKKNYQILNDVINLTKDGKLKWSYEVKYNKYKSEYIVNNKISLELSLVARSTRHLSYLSVSLARPERTRFLKLIEGLRVSDLIDEIEKKKKSILDK